MFGIANPERHDPEVRLLHIGHEALLSREQEALAVGLAAELDAGRPDPVVLLEEGDRADPRAIREAREPAPLLVFAPEIRDGRSREQGRDQG